MRKQKCVFDVGRSGETGIHARLKIVCQKHEGSSPSSGTKTTVMHTLEPEPSLIKNVQKHYDIPRLAFLEKVTTGFLSQNFILKNHDKKYFLKQYRYNDRQKISEIHAVKFFFSNNGIPIILPLQTKDGHSFFEHGNTFYALFPFVQGRMIPRIKRSKNAFFQSGKMLGSIHLITKPGAPKILPKPNVPWNREQFFRDIEHFNLLLDKYKTLSPFDVLAKNMLRLKKKIALQQNIPYESLTLFNDHIIHGDYHGRNIFFDQHDTVQHVFDLEKTTLAPRAYELARSLDFMCFASEFNEKNFGDAKVYLAGYNSVYPISYDEFSRGMRFLFQKYLHSLWIFEEHYLKHSLRVDELLDSDFVSLQYYDTHLDTFLRRLAY